MLKRSVLICLMISLAACAPRQVSQAQTEILDASEPNQKTTNAQSGQTVAILGVTLLAFTLIATNSFFNELDRAITSD